MDNACISEAHQLGDQTTSYITDHLSNSQSDKSVEISCPNSEYDHYVNLLNLLYMPGDNLSDSFDSVKSAIGLLQASVSLGCEAVTVSCIEYLEAMPWEEHEEEEILKIVPTLGASGLPILARFQPADLDATRNVFISAIRFATSVDQSFPPFTDELKISAQEQVEYMLAEDEETPLVTVDEQVKSEAKAGLARMLDTFITELSSSSLALDSDQRVLQSVSDLDWICNILPKMELMADFVTEWVRISEHVLKVVQDEKYGSGLWAVKVRVVELVGKALDAVGFGHVVLPAVLRIRLLKTWLPYLRAMKPMLDSKCEENEGFPYKMDADLCQNIEGAIVSLVLALPSNDQAEILGDWMKRNEELRFPDLTEAFEVWCYRAKAAKRRLVVGFSGVGSNPTENQQNLEQQKAQEDANREAEERRQLMLSQMLSAQASEILSYRHGRHSFLITSKVRLLVDIS